MKEINIMLFDNGTFKCDGFIIGKTLENNATVLNIKLTDELSKKDFFIEFEKPDNEKVTTYKLNIENNKVIYEIPSGLLDKKGGLKVEFVLRENEQVWKSYNTTFTILESINASEEIPEKFPDFVTEATKILNHIVLDGDGKKFLSNDGTYKSVGGSGGGTYDYNDLNNKPSINQVELNGNKTLEELGIQEKGDYATKNEIPTKNSQLENDTNYLISYTETDPTVPDFVKAITEEDIAKWNSGGDNQEIYYITSSNIIELDTLEIGVYILLNNLAIQQIKVTDSRTQQIIVPFSYIVLFKKYNDASIGENFAYFYGVDGNQNTSFQKVWLKKTSSTESSSNNRYFQIVKSPMNFAYLTSSNSFTKSNYFQGDVHHMAFTKCYKNLTMDNNSIIICSKAPTTDDHLTNKKYVDKTQYEKMAGWNSEKTQILKNINGTLTWVDEV